MLITITGLLGHKEIEDIRRDSASLVWRNGARTAGTAARKVKHNQQADLTNRTGSRIRDCILTALKGHDVLRAAARPKRFSKLMLSRTPAGGGYGLHIDNALMGEAAAAIRSDLSYTLFLSDPADYEGGELVIEHPGATQALRPAAGDLVLYPSTTLHRVETVRAGERLAAVGWIESHLRDPAQRELLFDLENLRAELSASHASDSPEMLVLGKSISNLLRMWAGS